MHDDTTETNGTPSAFDFSAFPPNTLFHERRTGKDRRKEAAAARAAKANEATPTKPTSDGERRVRKERRKRIDPTTFEKQYTDDELEFMGAMQRFKERTGRAFPTYGEVLKVASQLGYRRVVVELEAEFDDPSTD